MRWFQFRFIQTSAHQRNLSFFLTKFSQRTNDQRRRNFPQETIKSWRKRFEIPQLRRGKGLTRKRTSWQQQVGRGGVACPPGFSSPPHSPHFPNNLLVAVAFFFFFRRVLYWIGVLYFYSNALRQLSGRGGRGVCCPPSSLFLTCAPSVLLPFD